MIAFVAPIHAEPKGRPRLGRRGAVYTPAKTKAFERAFRYLAWKYRPEKKLEGPLELVILFQLTKPKRTKNAHPCVRPDLDNFVKAVMDAMQDFWKDDAQIVRLYARKRYGVNPLIKVELGSPDEMREHYEL